MLKRTTICLLVVVFCGLAFYLYPKSRQNDTLILATTTSIQDTGLLDVLVDAFRKKSGYTVKPVAVGTGQALQMGRLGQADLLWVHSPADEQRFVAEGYGLDRTVFMHNDFVILGPENDPAGVSGTENAAEAFRKISEVKALFVSRGDNSGTHQKEKAIWKEAGVAPGKDAYLEVGQGMARTVTIADEKQAYVLTDSATYLALKKVIDLVLVSRWDPGLVNEYSLILVNPDKFPKVNAAAAKALADYMLSEDSRAIIESFGKEKFGQQLFFWDLKGTP